jgi:phage terminase large subunit-like protein
VRGALREMFGTLPMTLSRASQIAQWPREDREQWLNGLTKEQIEYLPYLWKFWARPNQLPPEPRNWISWIVCAGRGFGKTRTGAETTRDVAMGRDPYVGPKPVRIALVGRSVSDVRDTMVEGEAGILEMSPPNERPKYEPSKRKLTWPNGSVGFTYSADEPKQLRGPAHHFAWGDELAQWVYPDAHSNLMFGLRLGAYPWAVFTTTPKPRAFFRRLLKKKSVTLTRGTSYQNLENLPQTYIDEILSQYEGTQLGLQEIYANIIDETPGALWKRAMFENFRVPQFPTELVRIVVGVDPSVTDPDEVESGTPAEAGIIVAGKDARGHGYLLDDLSFTGSSFEWASTAVDGYDAYHADRIVAEKNQGGDLVKLALRTVPNGLNAAIKLVHASRGKLTRAEPIVSLYEQGKIHHVGLFDDLEDQMCTWVPGFKSPDRMDAAVWALSELMLQSSFVFR